MWGARNASEQVRDLRAASGHVWPRQARKTARAQPGLMPDPTDAPSPSASQAPDLDAPSPQVEPQFLRPRRAPAGPAPMRAPAQDVDATLVEAITRIVSGMLHKHISESVTAAVRALAPRLVVSLGPDEVPGDAQVRARPARAGTRDR